MVDIVIPNYNGESYLKNCIESVLKQTYTDFRIIVIDNNSTDSLYSWIYDYKNIIFKRLDKNYGFSKAVNEGIKLSKSKFVVMLNNDTEVDKEWLKNLVELITSNKKIFSVSSKMIRYDNKNIIDDAGDEYTLLGWTLKMGDGKSINKFNKQRLIFSSCAGAAIYRISMLEKIGYFDENFFAYMEDVDISYRALINGYKNVYCPDAKVYHIGSATSGSKYNSFKVNLSARNNIYVIYKNMPIVQMIFNSPFLLVGFLIKYLFFIKCGFGKEYRSGILSAFRQFSEIEKIKFKYRNIFRYIYIEWLLIINTFKLFKK
ncbi:glycosyltransferase family 2 protein [Clostridioides sp. ES-S-0123-01]|uniref:glycosyltransferase family 2 protein n=1 Tax=Clostridioides sp. ES-S-0123-01 TaxID=2770783 RepID=UPI001D10CD3E